MEILHDDVVLRVPPGTAPNYDAANPLLKLMGLIEAQQLAAGREYYLGPTLQYLFPITHLELYGPSGADSDVLDPTRQDNKTDFQKQNVADFTTAPTRLMRGFARVAGQRVPFLRLSYDAGPGTPLYAGAEEGQVKLFLKVGAVAASDLLTVPYNERTDRYEIELWGAGNIANLEAQLDSKGKAALRSGELVVRSDLVQGGGDDFARDKVQGLMLTSVQPAHAMHPLLPLAIEVAWANNAATRWDSQGGRNYLYEFNMVLRGWQNFLEVGTSPNPHGGVGFLEYRNLMSNYKDRGELGRTIPPWSFDAFGTKANSDRYEDFFTVDYMDLHIVKPHCGIGLHRHRDNQEVFLLMEGRAYMVVGDWCRLPSRERCIEVRSLTAGHMAMLKGGNLHALMNPTDENLSLFMFGGYD